MAENEAGIEEVELDGARVEAIRAAVEAGDHALVLRLMEPLHAADIADFLEQIDQRKRREFLAIYAGEIDGDLLSEIDETIREEVIESLPASVVAEAVRDLETDDVVDILEDLEASAQGRILDALDLADRVAVEQAMLEL
jgi:magnesium transporter